MWRDFSPSLSLVHVDDPRGVYGVPLVRINGNTEEPRIGLSRE